MNAISLLIQDHREAKKAMTAIDQASGPAKKTLFAALVRDLKVHDRIEENMLYPAVREFLETAVYSLADLDAHRRIGKALARLQALAVEDPAWVNDYDSMRFNLLRHFAEEEIHLFAKVRSYLSEPELVELGSRMTLEKERLMAPA